MMHRALLTVMAVALVGALGAAWALARADDDPAEADGSSTEAAAGPEAPEGPGDADPTEGPPEAGDDPAEAAAAEPADPREQLRGGLAEAAALAAELPDPVADGAELPEGYRESFDRDGILPIYEPEHVPAEEVGWADDALVLGVEIDGEARAYPIGPLRVREIVNDVVGGEAVLVSWCPLCGTGLVHRRELDGEAVAFGNQGDLYGNAMTWWDHATGSVWSQPLGEAILGELEGERLELLPSTLTEWAAWRRAHPDTLALALDGPGGGPGLDNLLVVVEAGGEAVGFPLERVRAEGLIVDEVGGQAVALVGDADDALPWLVLAAEADGAPLDLERDGDRLVDPASGSAWDAARGRPLDGPLDAPLELVPTATVLPRDFGTFFPDGEVR